MLGTIFSIKLRSLGRRNLSRGITSQSILLKMLKFRFRDLYEVWLKRLLIFARIFSLPILKGSPKNKY